MALVLDTAVLIAAERGDRGLLGRVAALTNARAALVVPTGCIAQAWRDGARQARLARFLAGCVELPLDPATARRAGELLAATDTSDVVDASVAAAARPGDVILTGDPDDLQRLVDASGTAARVAPL